METIDLSNLKSQVCFSPARLQKMQADLEKMLTRAVEDLKAQLRRAQGSGNRRGVFDTLKNWWSNVRHGYKNPQNPYFHQNTLGFLGRPVKEMSLHEYKYLVEKSNRLEKTLTLTEGKLQLDVELDNWLSDIKNDLSNYFSGQIQRAVTKTAPKTAAKVTPKKAAPPEKFSLAGGDIEKSFFGSKEKKPDDLLGLPPEDVLFDKETTTVDADGNSVTDTDTSVVAAPIAASASVSQPPETTTTISPDLKAQLQAVQDRIINPSKAKGARKKKEVGGEKPVPSKKPKVKKEPEQAWITVPKPVAPVINPTEPEPAAVTPPLAAPVRKRSGGKPGMGGGFFESNENLKLNGLTLYEKTLVCLDKLRINS